MNHTRTSWLRVLERRPGARLRLLCFPHAGAGASVFRRWTAALPAGVEPVAVQYPGREDRLDEPLVDRFTEVVAAVVADLAGSAGLPGAALPGADLPWALFGHSMGAALAHEVAVAAREQGLPEPAVLVVSGREAPTRIRPADVHTRDEAGLRAELARLGGMPMELLEHPELRALFLPVIRNDYRLIETYRPAAHDPLSCPVTALVGDADPEVDADEAAAWARITTGPFRLRVLPGDHFTVLSHGAVTAAVAAELGAAEPGR